MARLARLAPSLPVADLRPVKPQLTAGGTGFARLSGGSSTQRGYGADWRRVRLQVLADEPLCRFCAAEDRVTAATDVDHIEPFNGLDDPLRLARGNLRPLCRPCHLARTARQASGRG